MRLASAVGIRTVLLAHSRANALGVHWGVRQPRVAAPPGGQPRISSSQPVQTPTARRRGGLSEHGVARDAAFGGPFFGLVGHLNRSLRISSAYGHT